MKSIRIVYLVSTLEDTGPVSQLLNLVRSLPPRKFDVTVLTLSREPRNSRIEAFCSAGIRVQTLSLSRLVGMLSGASVLRDALEKLRPDIVHSQGYRADVLLAETITSAKRVCTIRNVPQDDYSARYGRILARQMCRRHGRAWGKFDERVAVSNHVAENAARLSGVKVLIVRNGVNIDKFRPASADERRRLREKLDLSRDATVWVVSGQLTLLKDPLLIINAFLSTRTPEDVLLVAGDGPLAPQCRRQAEGSSAIRILGHVDDIATYLRASDFLVSASRSEGFPNAVIEALASGLLVLLSNIPPHEEIVSLDRCAGGTFEVGSRASLQAAMRKFASMDHNRSSSAALQIARNELNSRVMSSRYQQIYCSLITSDRVGRSLQDDR